MAEWQNRIIGLEWKAANQLLANPDNPREHPALQRDTLRSSLDDIGWYDVVIENRLTGYLIDGHARVEEALSKDENMLIPVLVVEMNESEQDAATLSHDWIAQLATYNNDKTDMLLKRVQMTDEFSWIWQAQNNNDKLLETSYVPESRSIIRNHKRRMLRTLHQETFNDVLILPQVGESLHLISNGVFDFFTLAAILIDAIGNYSEHLYACTWTINLQTILDLFDYYDNKRIGSINILSDRSFKRRKPANYAQLIQGLQQRGQRYIANHNHSKIVLLNNGDNYLTIEGSASFTTNPRLEQHVITNDYELWLWYKQWMETILNG